MVQQFDEVVWISKFFDNTNELQFEGIERIKNFVFLWSLFEKYGCHKNANVEAIQEVAKDLCLRDKTTQDVYIKHLDYFVARYISDAGVPNDKFEGLKFKNKGQSLFAKEKVINVLTKKEVEAQDILLALLFIALRLRNNLFHGEKNILKLECQIENFTVINDLLANVLETMKRNHLLCS